MSSTLSRTEMGAAIRAWREARGWRRERLAVEMGNSASSVARHESGLGLNDEKFRHYTLILTDPRLTGE